MSHPDIRRAFERHPALGALPPAAFRRLVAASRSRRLAEGERLCSAGEPARQVFLLTSGFMAASVDLAGGMSSTVEVFQAGDAWGCLAHLERGRHFCDVHALAPSTLVAIASGEFFRVAEAHPRLYRSVAANAASRMARLIHLKVLCSEKAERALCGLLLWLRESTGDVVPMTYASLATFSGLTIETVSRNLAPLKRRGWIANSRGRIVILDASALRRALERA